MGSYPYQSLQEEVQALFDWNPLTMWPDIYDDYGTSQSIRDSEKPRVSEFYDRHISDRLILKRLVHVQNLHKYVADEASTLYDSRLKSGTVLGYDKSSWINRAHRLDHYGPEEPDIHSTSMLQHIYKSTTHLYCSPVASSLKFHPTVWTTILNWKPVPCNKRVAVWDASLQFLHAPTLGHGPFLERMEVEHDKRSLVLAVQETFPDIATWEFTSMLEGSMDTMLTMQLMASSLEETPTFEWERPSSFSIPGRGHKRLREDEDIDILDDPDTESWIQLCSSRSTFRRSARLANNSRAPRELKRRRLLDDAVTRGGTSLATIKAMDRKLWKRISVSPWSTYLQRDKLATTESALNQSANTIFQRAWAESVRQRSTVVVINAGNFEFICIRHRASQTLYVSDVLPVPKLARPGYGQVQVGLYLVALDDAMRRVRLIGRQSETPGDASPDIARSGGVCETSVCDSGGGTRRSKGSRPLYDGEADLDDITFENHDTNTVRHEVSSRKSLVIFLRFDIYYSLTPSIFVPASASRANVQTAALAPKERVNLILTSKVGYGATGISHGGRIEIKVKGKTLLHRVVVKMAFTEEQREFLVNEVEIYRRLSERSVRGIPTCFGLFSDTRPAGPNCLVLSHAGCSLLARKGQISAHESEGFLSTLKSIHEAGVIHGDIQRLQNLLIDDEGLPNVIDFSHARMSASKDAFDDEYNELSRFLRSASSPSA